MALNEKITETDKLIEGRFRRHQHAEVIASMPGIGPLLGAEFLAATGGDMDAVAQLTERGRWHAGLIARLCDRLAMTPEGDGTALDNTLIVWCSEVSLGNSHSHTDMPFLVLGGGWHFRTGRYLQLTQASHSNLLVSLLNAMGLPAQTFGLPEHCTGPLVGLV